LQIVLGLACAAGGVALLQRTRPRRERPLPRWLHAAAVTDYLAVLILLLIVGGCVLTAAGLFGAGAVAGGARMS
jgi:hypothetical protein